MCQNYEEKQACCVIEEGLAFAYLGVEKGFCREMTYIAIIAVSPIFQLFLKYAPNEVEESGMWESLSDLPGW